MILKNVKHQMRLVLLLCMAMFVCSNANAENYIFYNKQPLVAVSGKGDFSGFSITADGNVPDQEMLKKIGTLDGMPLSFKVDYIGCDEEVVLDTNDNGLLSSQPLNFKKTDLSKETILALEKQGRELLSSVLKAKGLSAKWIAEILKVAEVKPVTVLPNQAPSLVITANHENNEKTVTALLVAMPTKQGKYVIKYQKVATGSPSDSEGFAGTYELVLHVDMDGDNIEELLFDYAAYESFGNFLLYWDGAKWIDLGGNSGGC
jgi:hypothetical protein